MNPDKLRLIGWKPFFRQQLTFEESEQSLVVRVSAHFGSRVLVHGGDDEWSVPSPLLVGVGELAVGDWVLLKPETQRGLRRLERQTVLARKAAGEEIRSQLIAANIDTMFVVCSCNQDFSLSRIERYLALILQSEAVPVVVLTKADLHESPGELRRQVEQLHAGLLVETLDARDPDQVRVLNAWCGPGQSVALLGSSGVGKSTLANALGAGDLATSGIREQDGKGRHTTTARSLHLLPDGGVLIDNPGMRELQLTACEDGVADLFEDVFAIAQTCRFRNCGHDGDEGCAVQAALESGQLDHRRFVSFSKLNAEQARNSESLAERRQRDRKTGRFYKSVIAEKKQRRRQ